VNLSSNSFTFIERITPWFPTMRIITTAINPTIPHLMYFPASGGGASLSVEALYKINVTPSVVH